jgi:hypothetical protein
MQIDAIFWRICHELIYNDSVLLYATVSISKNNPLCQLKYHKSQIQVTFGPNYYLPSSSSGLILIPALFELVVDREEFVWVA